MTSMAEFIRVAVDRPQKGRLRISMAGGDCERRAYYQATDAPRAQESTEGLIKMGLGSALDAWALQRAPRSVLEFAKARTQVPVEIEMGGLRVDGSADLVFYDTLADGGLPLLVSDLKCVGESTWEKVAEGPKQEHRAQVQLYAFGLGAPRWSVCYVRAATGEIREHFGETDAFAARRDFAMFETVAYWMKRGEPPPRCSEDVEDDEGEVRVARDNWPCRYCAYEATCWGPRPATEGAAT